MIFIVMLRFLCFYVPSSKSSGDEILAGLTKLIQSLRCCALLLKALNLRGF